MCNHERDKSFLGFSVFYFRRPDNTALIPRNAINEQTWGFKSFRRSKVAIFPAVSNLLSFECKIYIFLGFPRCLHSTVKPVAWAVCWDLYTASLSWSYWGEISFNSTRRLSCSFIKQIDCANWVCLLGDWREKHVIHKNGFCSRVSKFSRFLLIIVSIKFRFSIWEREEPKW